ncbi:hypothetical protein LEP1GSC036_1982 [Leptospira weilii str. 2006001853]|uniref:Uncharacterized protein n=1 Tax=Leptospira weilii str. 2006001853 TaxID=1001589 RepID=A0A828YXH9_9LEPT|nr:hypothetical protein LEP1GSC036_1982 [Leptospira weilii str. 2006001853]
MRFYGIDFRFIAKRGHNVAKRDGGFARYFPLPSVKLRETSLLK